MDESGKSLVTTPEEREIRVERVFDAPRERVFAAFTTPELVAQWWRPADVERETTVVELDPRAGGRWRFEMEQDDGTVQGFQGVFREVVAPELIAWTFEWDGMPGRVSVETVNFEDLGERTRIVSVSIFHTVSERDSMLDSGMEKGMNETFARLDGLLLS